MMDVRAGAVRATRVAAACALIAGVLFVPLWAAQAPSPRVSRDFNVGQKDVWTPTDLEVKPGERVVFSAKGSASCGGAASSFGPDGIPRGFRDLLRILPMPQAGRGALLGRIGEADVAQIGRAHV